MSLSADSREFIELLNSHAVEYVLVGAHSVAFHATPRYTGDVDILVRPTAENADRIVAALTEFGFGSLGLERSDFLTPDQVIQLGRAPNRIDLLTGLSGVSVADCFTTKIEAEFDGIRIAVVSREVLLRNKRATGRPQDLADVAAIEAATDPSAES